ncbi:Guanylate kinase sub-group [Penicillium psychrosexuale]|uniref:Guanylate kinase sub-group n=1 Tax=Penicillium psychrosexuale TaxID=1002107 RepID=UPI002545B14D|nr:Guanylate kinase sub-group [Penicillium psychrosexuale]KAJ5795973.1 Guanylate kinase sub-group [Penicillium psychrosexuale]
MFELTVSHTTRQPRPGEKDGISYHFVSVETYNTLKHNGDLIEDAMYTGAFYGTKTGVQQVKTSGFDARYVFVKPRDLGVLEERLRGRGTESEKNIRARLDRARRELEFAETAGVFQRVIVNDDLGRAYAELEDFVFGLG